MRQLIVLAGLLALFGCGAARPPKPQPPAPPPSPNTTEKMTWQWDAGSCVSYFIVQVSDQDDPELREEWTEIARTEVLPSEGNPFVVDFPDRPVFVLVRAVCTNGAESGPSNVREVK